ncbi:MAG: YgiQ family radical SAM protein [Desulfuromonadaceae bacterium]|nr:YgiQ family radical SAM protein [Desulfuromonas sp.]MDY0185924.1 YgiQ family radical SAM protein [Desulfuromonadaceae bacterium]
MSKDTTAMHIDSTLPFIPTSRVEMEVRGWDELDVLLVSGDAYVDHPSFGVPLLARTLEAKGWRVGIIAQPDWRNPATFQVMGRPRLCVAISSGAMDSMVNHYTAAKKVRNDDAYTPGGVAGARPDRALIAYTAAVKGAFKNFPDVADEREAGGVPVIIGGIEASLRRLAHYDYWSDKVRRSILVDSKADLLVYGMAEKSLEQVVSLLDSGRRIEAITRVDGTAWLSSVPVTGEQLPSFAALEHDKTAYAAAFAQAERAGQKRLVQEHAGRYLVVNPPTAPMSAADLDAVYALPFTRRPHPTYREVIPAFTQIRWSVTSHRGCQGGCAFCAISAHQGRQVQSRSPESIVAEVKHIARDTAFGGTITDVGGPTANMYATTVFDSARCQRCQRDSCLYPAICTNLNPDDTSAAELLRTLRQIAGVKHVYVASGIRFDLLARQPKYRHELLHHHIGGLLKVAPEALSAQLLKHMRKPAPELFESFLHQFYATQRQLDRRCSVVPYLMAGHPGSTLDDMLNTALVLRRHGLEVEQVQEFTPTPGTLATCVYYTGIDPFSEAKVAVSRDPQERRLQKALLLAHQPQQYKLVRSALRQLGREDLFDQITNRTPKQKTNRPADNAAKRTPPNGRAPVAPKSGQKRKKGGREKRGER